MFFVRNSHKTDKKNTGAEANVSSLWSVPNMMCLKTPLIIRILTQKHWKIDAGVLINIYKSLVRSIMAVSYTHLTLPTILRV